MARVEARIGDFRARGHLLGLFFALPLHVVARLGTRQRAKL